MAGVFREMKKQRDVPTSAVGGGEKARRSSCCAYGQSDGPSSCNPWRRRERQKESRKGAVEGIGFRSAEAGFLSLFFFLEEERKWNKEAAGGGCREKGGGAQAYLLK